MAKSTNGCWRRFTVLGAVLLGWSWSASAADDFRVSLSVSPFAEMMFESGIAFTDGKLTAKNLQELQQLFVAHGANEVYARIETRRSPPMGKPGEEDGGIHSLERGLARARLAKALNLPFNPELGLFSNYGDLRYQPAPDFSEYPQLKVPGEWSSLKLEQMLPVLRAYGELVAREILATGVKVRIWDLGNEVELGVAGVAVRPDEETARRIGYKPPDGVDPAIGRMSMAKLMKLPEQEQIAWLEKHLWPANAKMFAAVAEGIRSVDPQARFSTHVSGVTVRPAVYVAFFKAMNQGGYFPDEIGFSYYPSIAMEGDTRDRLEGFKETVTAAHRELGRPVFIAEFAYPATDEPIFLWENKPVKGYPLSAQGQASFLRDLVAWGVKQGIISGIRPWAPDLASGGWGTMSLFSLRGKTATARPAVDAIVEGYRVAGK